MTPPVGYDIIHIEKRALSPHNKKELHMPTLKLKAISSLEKCFYNDGELDTYVTKLTQTTKATEETGDFFN